jgi:hypothetical protein
LEYVIVLSSLEGITRDHGFSKGSTWLKCSHWPKRSSFWLKAWGMIWHMIILVGSFD